jgi:hypothetical protein
VPFGVILDKQLLQVAGILRPMNLPKIYNPITSIIKVKTVSFEFFEFGVVIKITASGTTIGIKNSNKITTFIWKLALIGNSYFCITFSSAAVCKLNFCGILLRSKTTKRRLTNCRVREAYGAGAICYISLGNYKIV